MRRTLRALLLLVCSILLAVLCALAISGIASAESPRGGIVPRGARYLHWGGLTITPGNTLCIGIGANAYSCDGTNPTNAPIFGWDFSGGPLFLRSLTCNANVSSGWDSGDTFSIRIQQRAGGVSSFLGPALAFASQPAAGTVYKTDLNVWTTAAEGGLDARIQSVTDTGTAISLKAGCTLEVW